MFETILTVVRAAETTKFGACKWSTHVDAGIASFSSVWIIYSLYTVFWRGIENIAVKSSTLQTHWWLCNQSMDTMGPRQTGNAREHVLTWRYASWYLGVNAVQHFWNNQSRWSAQQLKILEGRKWTSTGMRLGSCNCNPKQGAAHEPECSHVEHFCKTSYLNGLVHFCPLTVPVHCRLCMRKRVEWKVWSVECGV